MPNHIHGIIVINNKKSLQPIKRQYQKLPIIIGSFKSAVSKTINKINNNYFQRQKSYHDHIIRDKKSLDNIRRYIINNPNNVFKKTMGT